MVSTIYEPPQYGAVDGLELLDELVDGAGLSDAVEESPDEVLVAVKLEELADDLGGLVRADLLHVHLNVLEEVVGVQVGGHLVDEVVPVADMDEGAGVGELRRLA